MTKMPSLTAAPANTWFSFRSAVLVCPIEAHGLKPIYRRNTSTALLNENHVFAGAAVRLGIFVINVQSPKVQDDQRL